MKAIEITSYGAPEVLRLGERPDPVPREGELLIRVSASGINRPDVFQRTGNYPVPPGASDIPGLEVAGVIVGGDAHALAQAGFKIGDRVCALVAGGGYAELCTAPIAQCLPVPKGLSDTEAASLPETFFTVWSNVFDRAHLQAGETFLIQGGSSGIGVTAIQLGKAMGAKVIVTAGSDEKCAACVKLGAEQAFNYRTQDFVEGVKQATGGKGVDVILDMAAGDFVPRELKALADEGRLVFIAFLRGPKTELDVNELMRRRLTLTGSTLRPRPVAFKGAIAARLRERVWPLIEAGKIKPVIYKTFRLEDAAEAHRLMETNVHVGKLVLTL